MRVATKNCLLLEILLDVRWKVSVLRFKGHRHGVLFESLFLPRRSLTPFFIFEEYFASIDVECTCKYIDPSYMVRSVPANAADSLYCMTLAQNAVRKIFQR